jgi:hypothetical protein
MHRLRTTVNLGLLFGVPFGIFVGASPFFPVAHERWLAVNNVIVAGTLGGAIFLGWRMGRSGASWGQSFLAGGGYALLIAVLFMLSYLGTTWWLADRMRWMPFFHRDYVRHAPGSVAAYLSTRDNYRQLAQLQVLSWALFAPVYAILCALGAAAARARSVLALRRS